MLQEVCVKMLRCIAVCREASRCSSRDLSQESIASEQNQEQKKGYQWPREKEILSSKNEVNIDEETSYFNIISVHCKLLESFIFSATENIIGNLIEGIAEDVPSVEANVDVEQALKTAIDNEGDDAADVAFNTDDDAQLVIYIMVFVSSDGFFVLCSGMWVLFLEIIIP